MPSAARPGMMNSPKKWVTMVLAGMAVATCILILVNGIIDPYGILRTDFSKQIQEPNQNFVKMKFILAHPERYDSFLFGSSRVIFIDNTKIRNGRYYNYWYSEGVPQEHRDNIRLLVQKGVRIRNILIGLDEFSYRLDPETHLTNLLRQPHPLITGKNLPLFYLEYFARVSGLGSNVQDFVQNRILNKGAAAQGKVIYDIERTGRMFIPSWDESIERDPDKHNRDEVFTRPTHYEGNNLGPTLEAIREIARTAKEQGIALTVFINPVHRTTYLDTDQDQFFAFKKELATITDYYDFSGLNSITTNNYYYYETSHYREMVGDMMLARMFGYPNVTVPADFGVLVTRRNMDAHLARQATMLDEERYRHHAGPRAYRAPAAAKLR